MPAGQITPIAAQAPSEAQHSVAREEEQRQMAVAPHERRSEAMQVFFMDQGLLQS